MEVATPTHAQCRSCDKVSGRTSHRTTTEEPKPTGARASKPAAFERRRAYPLHTCMSLFQIRPASHHSTWRPTDAPSLALPPPAEFPLPAPTPTSAPSLCPPPSPAPNPLKPSRSRQTTTGRPTEPCPLRASRVTGAMACRAAVLVLLVALFGPACAGRDPQVRHTARRRHPVTRQTQGFADCNAG